MARWVRRGTEPKKKQKINNNNNAGEQKNKSNRVFDFHLRAVCAAVSVGVSLYDRVFHGVSLFEREKHFFCYLPLFFFCNNIFETYFSF